MANIYTLSSEIVVGNAIKCAYNMVNMISDIDLSSDTLVLFQSNPFTGSSYQNLIYNPVLTDKIYEGIQCLSNHIKSYEGIICFSQVVLEAGSAVQKMFVLNGKNVQSYCILEDSYVDLDFGDDKIILLYNLYNKKKGFFSNYSSMLKNKILCVTSDYSITAGKMKKISDFYRNLSEQLNCNIYFANGSTGDSSYPYVYKAFIGNFVSGNCNYFDDSFYCSLRKKFPLDNIQEANVPEHTTSLQECEQNKKTPYIYGDQKIYLKEILDLQTYSLYCKLKNLNIKQLVIGVSGGLDSTLALIVSVLTLEKLELPRENITALTMPGFATSDRTYDNAGNLIKNLGCTFKEIRISDSLKKHFEDIGHDISIKDVTYENAQARERTQILLDISNKKNGLMVGTSDLSEDALGFCTFAGDHIANFNVNTCLTKTMVRYLIKLIIDDNMFPEINDALENILDTPVSPELLGSDSGEIEQKTEDILGPYILHDFFLYSFLMQNLRPNEILTKAVEVFKGEYDIEFIRTKLRLFFKKFFASQFKRTCAPESSIITDFNLSNIKCSYPSEFNPEIFEI